MHRTVGFTSFNLMLAHVVLITWGYAAGSLLRWPVELWDLTRTYPAMLLADAGFVALVLVVVTSVRAARRRLRYESWHLHAPLRLPRAPDWPCRTSCGPGRSWSPRPVARSSGGPPGAPRRSRCSCGGWRCRWPATCGTGLRVEEVVEEAPGVVSVVVTGRHLDRLPVQGGQWMSWRFLGRDGWSRANPYSLSAAPDGRRLRITVQSVGDGSGSTATLTRGSRVLVEGPYGRLSPRSRHGDKVAMIGAGVGSAPLVALAEELAPAGDVVVLHRASGPGAFTEDLRRLAARGVRVLHLPGRRRAAADSWLGDAHAGRFTDLAALRHWVPDIAHRDVYVCGPTPVGGPGRRRPAPRRRPRDPHPRRSVRLVTRWR